MPIVVAKLHPQSDKLDDLIRVYTDLIPEIHAEPGCELFSLHRNETSVVLIERWATPEDLEAHIAGDVLPQIRQRIANLVTAPAEIEILHNVPAGTSKQGTIQ